MGKQTFNFHCIVVTQLAVYDCEQIDKKDGRYPITLQNLAFPRPRQPFTSSKNDDLPNELTQIDRNICAV